MANKYILFSILLSNLLSALTINKWSEIPATGIADNTNGDFTYNETGAKDFVLTDSIFFANPRATLSIRTVISGNWKTKPEGLIFYNDNKKLTFNSGNLSFYINSNGVNVFDTSGYFQLSNSATLDINANLSISASAGSDFSNGVFNLNNSDLHITDANLSINLSNNQKLPTARLFSLNGKSSTTINSGGNKSAQNIYLKGGIEVKDTSSFELNLANQNSYYEGVVSLSGGTFALNLSNSNATFTTYAQQGGIATLLLENGSALNSTIIGNTTDLIINSNSTWNMWGQNNNGVGANADFANDIRNLTIQNATVNFMKNADGSKRFGQDFMKKSLTGKGTLIGAGTFAIYGDVASKGIDTITFAKADGSHSFDILYNPNTFTQALAEGISTRDNMVVATINDANTQATFSALPTIMGLTSYTTHLEKLTNNGSAQWVIANVTPDGESPLSKALTTVLNAPYRLFESSSQTLNLRLGDLRNYPKDFGLYFHYSIAQNSFAGNSNFTAGKDLFMSMMGGFDMNAMYRNHNDFFGFGFEIDLLDTTTDLFTSSSQAYGGFLYYTSVWSNKFYYDIVLKYAYSPTDLDLGDMASSTSFSAHLLNLSAEVGSKFAFNSNKSFFYIEPQAKLTSGFIAPTSLSTTDPNGTSIKGELDFQFPLLIKSSLYLGYEWNEGFIGDLKAGVFIDYSLFNGADTTLSDQWSEFKKGFDMDFDVGVSIISNITLKDYLRFYLQLDTSFLGSYTNDVLFNAGIRWSFGDRYVPPPPPPADPNRLKVRKLRGNTVRDIPTIKKNDRANMKHYEGNRNEIINSYPQNSPSYQSPSGGYQEEEWNTNRFYPRDNYVPNRTQNPTQEKYRSGGRDMYQPQGRVAEESNRYYKQDTYSPNYSISQEQRYNARRQLK